MTVSEYAWLLLIIGAFIIGLPDGLLAAATRYCNLGAVADWVNIGDMGRMRAWLLSIAVVVFAVALLDFTALVDFDQTRVNYRMAEFPHPPLFAG